MCEIIAFPQNVNPNKSRSCDRAAEVAETVIAEVFHHIWNPAASDLDIPALNQRIAGILRPEFAHAGRRTTIADRQIFDALDTVLGEFGECDLRPRLRYLAEDNDPELLKQGRELLRAFDLLQAWSNKHALTPDDVRKSFEQSDLDWECNFETEDQETGELKP
jgi:hypothetical protein